MNENPIILAGIPIPFRDPVLLAILAVHVAARNTGSAPLRSRPAPSMTQKRRIGKVIKEDPLRPLDPLTGR